MKKMVLLGIGLFVSLTLFAQIANHVVISEVYGGGGNAGAPFKNDYIELYNPTSSDVDLTGWSVQYASATGTFSTNLSLINSGTIPAHGFFLIQGAAGAGTQTNNWTADLVPSTLINLSGTAGKVALASKQTAISGIADPAVIDFVGFGTTANSFEGSGPTPAPSNSTSIERKAKSTSTAVSLATAGTDVSLGNGWDSNNNSADFVAQSVLSPQNSGSSLELPPTGNNPPSIGVITKNTAVPALDSTVELSTSITDADGTVATVKFAFRVNGGNWDSTSVNVTNPSGSTYTGVIPASANSTNGNRVEYFVIAYDNNSAMATSSIGGYFAGVTPISPTGLKSVDGSGNLLYSGYNVKVNGVCIIGGPTSPSYSTTNLQGYLQDAVGGINIFNSNLTISMVAGNSYTVEGTISNFSGLAEILNPIVTDNGPGTMPQHNLLTLATLSTDPEAYEGSLIAISNLTKTSGTWGNNASITLTDDGGTNSIVVNLDSDVTDWTLVTEPSYPADFGGILVQVSAGVGIGKYQLKPRVTSDITPVNTLPVELSSFTVSASAKNALIKWETTTEKNNAGFEVLRNGQAVGFVSGKGTTTEKQSYSFTDKNVSGTVTYQLKQVDTDGKVSFSQILSFVGIPSSFEVAGNYPNPFNPTTIIKFTLPEVSTVVVKVHNIIGQEIATLVNGKLDAGIKEIRFDAKGLSSGIYFYSVSANGKTFTKSMTLMK